MSFSARMIAPRSGPSMIGGLAAGVSMLCLASSAFAFVPPKAIDPGYTPHAISGELVRRNIAATDFSLEEIQDRARKFSLRNWRQHMLAAPAQVAASSGEVPAAFAVSAGIGDFVYVLGETAFGVGAILTSEAGCEGNVLEKDDLAVILSMTVGALKDTDVRALRIEAIGDGEEGGSFSKAVTSHFGRFAAIESGALEFKANTGQPARIDAVVADRFAEDIIYRIYKAHSYDQKPFFGLSTGGVVRSLFVDSVARNAEIFYREKSRVCRFVKERIQTTISGTNDGVSSEPSHILSFASLSGQEQQSMAEWKEELRSALYKQIKYPKNSLRRKEEGTARVAVIVRRDGKVLGWRMVEGTQHERLNTAVKSALKKLDRVESFPYNFAGSALEYELPITFEVLSSKTAKLPNERMYGL